MKNESNFNVRKISRVFLLFSIVCLCSIRINGQTYTINTVGSHNGWYFHFWDDESQGTASMMLGDSGIYSTTWTNVGNFIAGKGWNVGSPDRIICYEGTFNGGSNGNLAVYGWTENQLVEYYVLENHGAWTPPGTTGGIEYMGSFNCDGGTYKIYRMPGGNYGINTYFRYWSVRTEPRSSGTVTFSKHVEEWKKYGMNMGTKWAYQLVITEGYQSSGSSNITVFECEPTPIIVEITEPVSGTVFTAPAIVNISATASKASGVIGKVEFYNGATKLGEDMSEPFSFSWENVEAGTYSLTAVATEIYGATQTSAALPVVVENVQDKIVLKRGWNIIGSPISESTAIEIALQGIWDKVEVVKDFNSYYLRSNPSYLNTLMELEWGKGYMIKVIADCELEWIVK